MLARVVVVVAAVAAATREGGGGGGDEGGGGSSGEGGGEGSESGGGGGSGEGGGGGGGGGGEEGGGWWGGFRPKNLAHFEAAFCCFAIMYRPRLSTGREQRMHLDVLSTHRSGLPMTVTQLHRRCRGTDAAGVFRSHHNQVLTSP